MKRKKNGKKWYGRISYKGHDEEITQPANVESKIRKAQNDIAGPDSGLSDELISLEVASCDVPDLTLIDLPGLARVAVKGQPENIGDQIKRLIQKFIQKQETILLVVVPSNVDIATTEALKMAQQVDPDGERTLGILTKPDLVDKGTEQTVLDIIYNQVIHLKKGYMIVRCRGQKEITEKVSLSEAAARENAFFKDHAHFRILQNEGYATIPKLAEKLTVELVHHIQKSLPNLEDQIERKLKQTQQDLDKYGNGPPSDASERFVFLIDKLTEFSKEIFSLTSGEELKFGVSSNIFSIIRMKFDSWKKMIDQSGVTFSRNIEKEVTQYERKHRGRELPGFINYKTFEGIVKAEIQQLEEPAVLKLKEVAEIVKKEMFEVTESCFVGFPNLIRTAKMKIEDIRKGKEAEAESILRTQFKMEAVVYTQDLTYSKKLGKRKREEEKSDCGFGRTSINSTVSNDNSGATLKEMVRHLKSYYQIAGKRLADQIPLVIRYQMLQESAIQLQREMLLIFQDKKKTDSLLQEDPGIKTLRTHLQNRQNRLLKARTLLTDFTMNIFNF